PSPPKPRLNPVTVSPHCALPRSEFQLCCTRLQSFPSTACSRLAGSSRLVTRLSPTPLKKLSRQLSVVTLWGVLILLSSAWMRAFMPLTAACVTAAQPALPVAVPCAQTSSQKAVFAMKVKRVRAASRSIKDPPRERFCRRPAVRRRDREQRCGG